MVKLIHTRFEYIGRELLPEGAVVRLNMSKGDLYINEKMMNKFNRKFVTILKYMGRNDRAGNYYFIKEDGGLDFYADSMIETILSTAFYIPKKAANLPNI